VTFKEEPPSLKGSFEEKKSQLSRFLKRKCQLFLHKRRLEVALQLQAIVTLPQQLKLAYCVADNKRELVASDGLLEETNTCERSGRVMDCRILSTETNQYEI
jgi:hypothetical protein